MQTQETPEDQEFTSEELATLILALILSLSSTVNQEEVS